MTINKKECAANKTSIGGQALIEGVMMRGKNITAMSVRLPDNTIDTEIIQNSSLKDKVKLLGLPFIRGFFNFVEMMIFGYKCLMKSAEKAGLEEDSDDQKNQQDKEENEEKNRKLFAVVGVLSMILGTALSLVLFLFLPSFFVKLFSTYIFDVGYMKTLFEGLVKIAVFVAYIASVSLLKDIRRVFEYHGAEHKSIACLEAGDELTVENARKHLRFHPRCGTSFILIVLIVSIIINSFIPTWNLLVRTCLKLLLIPLVVSIGYEIIKFAGKHDNIFTRIMSAPGLWLQRITTREPDDSQLEVALTALEAVLRNMPESKEANNSLASE